MVEWNKKELRKSTIDELANSYNVDRLTATILARRGIVTGEELKFFFEDKLFFLHSPFLLPDIVKAIDRVRSSIEEEEAILVFGDRDVDGITGSVLLFEVLQKLGANVELLNSTGLDDYGLTNKVVDKAMALGCTLIITVDCGCSNNKEIAYAYDNAVDIIVFDHHSPAQERPKAWALVNPRKSKYPLESISSATVVGKFIWALNFSFEDIYDSEFCILNPISEANKIKIEASVVKNMLRSKNFTGILEDQASIEAFINFIEGYSLVVYKKADALVLLRKVFGSKADINLLEFYQETEKLYPNLRGKSLPEIKKLSRNSKYMNFTDLDFLCSMFCSTQFQTFKRPLEALEESLELMALSVIADMMPLLNENRIIVKRGLARINKNPRSGLRELLQAANLNENKFTARMIAWKLSPILNSAGRMGRTELASSLFTGLDPSKRKESAKQLLELNTERRKLTDKIWQDIYFKAKSYFNEHSEKFIFLLGAPGTPRGVTGMLASRLSQQFNCPAILLVKSGDAYSGSLRSPKTFSILPILEEPVDLYLDKGGHPQAGGFRIEEANLGRLENEISKICAKSKLESASFDIDAEIPHNYFSDKLWSLSDKLQPYGVEFSNLVFLLRDVIIARVEPLGEATKNNIRLQLNFSQQSHSAIFWGGAQHYGASFQEDDKVDLLFSVENNLYRGVSRAQIIIQDIKKCIAK